MPTINHLLKHCAVGLCLLAALVLSACGPGTGGTGTGPNAVGSPSTFTSSYFTSGDTATASPTPSVPGTTCTAACPSALVNQTSSLHLQAERIELTTPCATFTYAGVWSVSAAGETTVDGVLESSVLVNGQISRSSQNASLTLRFPNGLEGSGAVTLSIQDGTGKLLLGPVTLQRTARVPASVAASGC
jgi:hypothetical protein